MPTAASAASSPGWAGLRDESNLLGRRPTAKAAPTVSDRAEPQAFFENPHRACTSLNKETRGIVKHSDLARMKPTALVVNTSRGPIIEEGALVRALKEGRPGFGAVDVFDDEPVLNGNHPLLKMDNVVCTPHLGYVDRDTYEKYYGAAVDNLLAYAEGKPVNVLNPEAMGRK
jgi:D-3-phosphoglycerate dehydrogenase